MTEAKVIGNNISFTNGFRFSIILFGLLWTMIGCITAYAYTVVIPKLADNIIENDKLDRARDAEQNEHIHSNRVLIAEIMNLKTDLDEIKSILKRTSPFERK